MPRFFACYQGYGARPTTNILIGIVFTLSECSPNAAAALVSSSKGRSSGASNNGGSAGGISGGGSGLTAGIDALRLACLQCLEVTMCACHIKNEDGVGSRSMLADMPISRG